jgi:hypothetical protein
MLTVNRSTVPAMPTPPAHVLQYKNVSETYKAQVDEMQLPETEVKLLT